MGSSGVPEKVSEKVCLEKVWEALVQNQVTFNRVPEKVPEKVAEKVCLVQTQVKFNRVAEKVPEKVPKKVWEALVQSPVAEKGWETLVQSQVRFNRVPEKVPEGFGAEPG